MKTFYTTGLLLFFLLTLAWGKDFQAAEVWSKETFRYGRFEARYKASDVPGTVSSFFLFKDKGWETDVMWNELDFEVTGKNSRKVWTNIINGMKKAVYHQKHHSTVSNLHKDFHTYSYEWTPEYIRWKIDSKTIREIKRSEDPILKDFNDGKMSIRMNHWPVANTSQLEKWAGQMNQKGQSQAVYDWVKYYKYNPKDEKKPFELVWADNFDTFNQERWNLADWTFPENRAQFVPQRMETKNGFLYLSIKNNEKETAPDPDYSITWELIKEIFNAVFSGSPDDDDDDDENPEDTDDTPYYLLGSSIPETPVTLLDGNNVNLNTYAKDKVLVLDFWATWCPPCVRGLPVVRNIANSFPKNEVQFLAVNQGETKEDIQKFLKNSNLSLSVAMDEDEKIGGLFGVGAIPQTVIVDKSGIIQSIHVGFENDSGDRLTQDIQSILDGNNIYEKVINNHLSQVTYTKADKLFKSDNHQGALKTINDYASENELNSRLKFLTGKIYYAMGEYPKARDILQELKEINYPYVWLHWYLAYAQYGMGSYEDALENIEILISAEPDYTAAKVLKMTILWFMGQKEDSEILLTSILENNPEDTYALFQAGEINYRKNNYKKALFYFDELNKIDSTSQYLQYYRSLCLISLYQPEEAKEAIQSEIDIDWRELGEANIHYTYGDYLKTIQILDKIDKKNKFARLYADYYLCYLHIELGNISKVHTLLKSFENRIYDENKLNSLKFYLDHAQGNYKNNYKILLENQIKDISSPAHQSRAMLRALIASSDLTEVESFLIKNHENDPENLDCLGSLGYYYCLRGKWEEGYRYLHKMDQIAPDQGITHTFHAFAFLLEGRFQESWNKIQKSKDFYGSSPVIKQMLVQYFFERGNYNEANEIADSLINENFFNNITISNKAMLLVYLDKPEQSLDFIRKYEELYPGHALLNTAKASALFRKGEVEKTEVILNKMAAEYPSNNQLWYLRGKIEIDRKDYVNAVKYFKQSLEIIPSHRESLIELTKTYRLLGQTKDAKQTQKLAKRYGAKI